MYAGGRKFESSNSVLAQLIPVVHNTGMGGRHCNEDGNIIGVGGNPFINSGRFRSVNLPTPTAR